MEPRPTHLPRIKKEYKKSPEARERSKNIVDNLFRGRFGSEWSSTVNVVGDDGTPYKVTLSAASQENEHVYGIDIHHDDKLKDHVAYMDFAITTDRTGKPIARLDYQKDHYLRNLAGQRPSAAAIWTNPDYLRQNFATSLLSLAREVCKKHGQEFHQNENAIKYMEVYNITNPYFYMKTSIPALENIPHQDSELLSTIYHKWQYIHQARLEYQAMPIEEHLQTKRFGFSSGEVHSLEELLKSTSMFRLLNLDPANKEESTNEFIKRYKNWYNDMRDRYNAINLLQEIVELEKKEQQKPAPQATQKKIVRGRLPKQSGQSKEMKTLYKQLEKIQEKRDKDGKERLKLLAMKHAIERVKEKHPDWDFFGEMERVHKNRSLWEDNIHLDNILERQVLKIPEKH